MATEFDELNVLEKNVDAFVENVESIANEPNRAMMRDEIEDDLEDLLIMAYAMGNDYAKRVLGIEDEQANISKMRDIIDEPIDGKTWKDRIREHVDDGDFGLIKTVIQSETDRVYNEAVQQTAEDSGIPNIYKTWVTMHDDRVRDTHDYIEGVSVPLNSRFYTLGGDSALRPMGFSDARNNCGCRCKIRITRK